MMRAFVRRIPAQEALNQYRERIRRKLDRCQTRYVLATSRDTHKLKGANGDYTPANEQSVKALNKELREPSKLILFSGGVYECTINDMHRGFCQSQTAFLLELPSSEAVRNYTAIKIWIVPPAASHTTFDMDNLPTRQDLTNSGLTEPL